MKRSCAIQLLAVTICASPFVAMVGCQPANRTLDGFSEPGSGYSDVPLKESWREFALENYAGELLVDLQTAMDVRFLHPPAVTASRNERTGATELVVLGQVDETNRQGNRLRHSYHVVWESAGSGWRLRDHKIGPGSLAPEPEKPLTQTPAVAPAATAPSPAVPTSPAP